MTIKVSLLHCMVSLPTSHFLLHYLFFALGRPVGLPLATPVRGLLVLALPVPGLAAPGLAVPEPVLPLPAPVFGLLPAVRCLLSPAASLRSLGLRPSLPA